MLQHHLYQTVGYERPIPCRPAPRIERLERFERRERLFPPEGCQPRLLHAR
jgi:hypothetical protein